MKDDISPARRLLGLRGIACLCRRPSLPRLRSLLSRHQSFRCRIRRSGGGSYGTNYIYPTEETISYFAGKGMTIIRLPFRWERLQPELGRRSTTTNSSASRTRVVLLIRKHKMAVLLDPHNFGYYEQDAARHAAGDRRAPSPISGHGLPSNSPIRTTLFFGLMNEPHDIKATDWLESRQCGDPQHSGGRRRATSFWCRAPHWTGAATWEKDVIGGPNGTVMLGVKDPRDNYAYEVHQYLDSDSSGTHADLRRAQQAIDAIVRRRGLAEGRT